MYKPEKVSFDKAFCVAWPILLKIGILFMSLGFFGSLARNWMLGTYLIGLVGLILLLVSLFFMQIYRLIFGFNYKGLYMRGHGWIEWKEIEDFYLGEAKKFIFFGRKLNCIFVTKKNGKKYSIICQGSVDIPLDQLLEQLKEYHRKYSENQN